VEEGSNPKLAIGDIITLDEAKPKLPRQIRIKIPLDSATPGTIDALQSVCRERKGEARVLFDLEKPRDFMAVMEVGDGYNVQADRAFIARVEELCVRGAVRVID
jgi:DNA polymerase-3 subunit alpha